MRPPIFPAFMLFLFLLTTFNLQAQDPNIGYTQNSIYLKGFNKYVKNGETYSNGFFYKKLEKELEVSPNAIIEFKKFKKNRNLGLILTTVGLGAILASPYIDNKDLGTVVAIGGLGAVMVTVPLSFKANNSFHKAIWLRNGMF